MPWRFGSRVIMLGPSTNRQAFDEQVGRVRWAFPAVLKRARDLRGGQITPDQAVAAIAPEFMAALSFIEEQDPDENVFGVIFNTLGVLPTETAVADAVRARALAKLDVQSGTAENNPSVAHDFFMGAAETLYDALRDFNPNDLMATVEIVRSLHAAQEHVDALSEWCDLYCRWISYSFVLRKTLPFDHILERARSAYGPFLTTAFAAELKATAQLLKADNLFDEIKAQWPLSIARILEETGRIEGAIGWFFNLYSGGGGYPSVMDGMSQALGSLFRLFRESHLEALPRAMNMHLLACVKILDQVLAPDLSVVDNYSRDYKLRVQICEVLGEIPLPETLVVLKKYDRSGNPYLRAKVQQAIASVTRSLIPNPASR